MTDDVLLDYLTDIQVLVPEDDYPESYAIAAKVAPETLFSVCDSAMAYADAFFNADTEKPMHELVAAFVKEVYEEEIEGGSAAAASNLGSLYYTGRLGEQDFATAVELYTLASERGDRQAAENLGYCYYYGRSVEIDYEKAFQYFALGAFDGHLISMYKIGDMYRNGYYVEKNEQEAFYIYRHCMETMTDQALEICGADIYMRMGDCLADGIGTERDCDGALQMYQAAETLFRMRIQKGDFMIRGNYRHCVDQQETLRAQLELDFPSAPDFIGS